MMAGLVDRRGWTIGVALLAALGIAAATSIAAEPVAQDNAPGVSATRQPENILKQVISEVRFEKTPFSDAIDQLRTIADLNIIVDWTLLADANIEKQTPVTLHLKNSTLADVLSRVLRSISSEEKPAAYFVSGSILHITTAERAAKETVIKIYFINDLLESAEPWQPGLQDGNPIAHLESDLANLRAQRDLLLHAGSPNLSGIASLDRQIDNVTTRLVAALRIPDWLIQDEQRRRGAVEALARLLQENVDRSAWVDNGGTTASLQYFQSKLIITASDEMHRQIESLLAKLRQKPPAKP